ncbi:MAG: helix-turn-helix domain-containing protein, partial [Bacillota bacterium]|nr:helix-turn-helix domain-containing protein [Bacillota bacterium]
TFLMKNSSAERALGLIDPSVLDALVRYDWPGNVRELQNVAERMLYLSGGENITCKYLPQNILEISGKDKDEEMQLSESKAVRSENPSLKTALGKKVSISDIRREEKAQRLEAESLRLAEALRQCHGNVAAAARKLGISRATFYRKLKDDE